MRGNRHVFVGCLNMPRKRVYPRVCGGTCQHRQANAIPACAGEPRYPTSAPSSLKVYPRVCGGTVNDFASPSPSAEGLSPRVRGNPSLP